MLDCEDEGWPGMFRSEMRGAPRTDALRFLLYSHDSWGLGHLKRSLSIASAITQRLPDANVLIVTGSPCATQFELPPNCDVLKLPSISKDAKGRYVPRSLSGNIAGTVELRSRLVLESYRSFFPHVVLVDHQLTGLHGEALAMLRQARADGRRIVYGMRDVLDEPSKVAAEWDSPESVWALKHGYDLVCVYGVKELFDPRRNYPLLGEFGAKVRFSGYVVGDLDLTDRAPVPEPRPNVLVTMGGGQDGKERVEAYLEALQIAPVPWTSHVITGPLMDPGVVRRFKRIVHSLGMTEQVRVSRFHANLPRLLQDSDAVVGMAGYNCCAEILQSHLPAVLMPRTFPRSEQLIRARRLQELGIVQCIESLDPVTLRAAVETALNIRGSVRHQIPLQGATRFCEMVSELLSKRPTHAGRVPRALLASSSP